MSIFASLLKSHLAEKKLKQVWLAQQLNSTRAYVSAVLSGNASVGLKFLKKLVAIPELDLELDTLLSWRLLDEYSTHHIIEALKVMRPEEREKVIQSLEEGA